MSKRTLKQVIDDYNKENGYESCKSGDYEHFAECLSECIVQESIIDQSRWYDTHGIVHQVTIDGEKRFFATFAYHTTGDACAGDMDLDMPTLDDVHEVYPEEIVTTVYR
jgi:hypothetical protein